MNLKAVTVPIQQVTRKVLQGSHRWPHTSPALSVRFNEGTNSHCSIITLTLQTLIYIKYSTYKTTTRILLALVYRPNTNNPWEHGRHNKFVTPPLHPS